MQPIASKFSPANNPHPAGNRWHLNCFRCNTCGTLLDSDANLLLLGDGSLICNNCTYSCSACGNKIEDLAILTGDQAFCATCFRCRNCKRKIENLRYARTSQGIFCMSCHESLMARRRKKSKAAAQAKAREKDGSPMITDKSLPALPPNAIPPNAFSNDRVDPESDTPTELSPRPRAAYSRADSSSRNSSRPDRSPERPSEPPAKEGGLTLPKPSYRNNRNSSIIAPSSDASGGDGESFFIPVALDPTPAASATPRSTSETIGEPGKKSAEKDYFTVSRSSSDKKTDSQTSTPHIAFQEKSRQPSSDYESSQPIKPPMRKLSKTARPDQNGLPKASSAADEDKSRKTSNGKASSGTEEFKLQDAPKSKKLISSRSPSQSSNSQENTTTKAPPNGSLRRDKDGLPILPVSDSSALLNAADKAATPRTSQDVRLRDDGDVRQSTDSLSSTSRPDVNQPKPITRKELPSTATRNGMLLALVDAASIRANTMGIVNGKPISGPMTRSTTSDELKPVGLATPPRPGVEHKMSDTYMLPRAPPAPPAFHTPNKESVTSLQESGSPKISPKLPRWSAGGDFSMDEDMARILGTDEGSTSILRRVSNAVRHGRTNSAETSHTQTRIGHTRSVSETTRATASPRWPKTPIAEDPLNGHAHDISSPISLHSSDDPAFLKRQLRNSEQRVAELERQFNTEKDLKNLNKKLIEKRKTVSVLDTQTEIMIRQLEVLAGYVERAKETKTPVDPRDLEDSAIKEFVQKLDKVKMSMTAAIEQLHEERDQLVDEKNQAMADRDRALLEFEQLSSKNAQLADLNNDLTHQIQERFKAQIGSDPKSPNGLGIYSQPKGLSGSSVNLDSSSFATSNTMIGHDHEEPILESGPTVVNIRKGQVRKFNWKKGSSKMAQNITRGVNRAVVALQQQPEKEPRHPGLTGDSIGLPYNMTVAPIDSPSAYGPNINGQSRLPSEGARKGFGFFKTNTMPKSISLNNMSTPALVEPPTTLFGSDLTERTEYERRQIPSVVTRCIEEVELRGMDVEGIYRKTGGNSQVKMIQEGFDKSEDFDISDPSFDITAVTSVLKQYFRKLPSPLLTYEVYERVLESNGEPSTYYTWLVFGKQPLTFILAIASEAERCSHLRKTFAAMPERHRDCLEFLMFHLARVAQREPENLVRIRSTCQVSSEPGTLTIWSDVAQELGCCLCPDYHAGHQPRERDDRYAREEYRCSIRHRKQQYHLRPALTGSMS
jgi:Rho-type GTPase-activating protein 1/2